MMMSRKLSLKRKSNNDDHNQNKIEEFKFILYFFLFFLEKFI